MVPFSTGTSRRNRSDINVLCQLLGTFHWLSVFRAPPQPPVNYGSAGTHRIEATQLVARHGDCDSDDLPADAAVTEKVEG